MTSSENRPPLHLGVALDGAGWHPAAWRERSVDPRALFTAQYWSSLARIVDDTPIDFLTVEDSLTLQTAGYLTPDDRSDQVRGRLDASLIAALLAPGTRSVGLIPVVSTTHTEPFHLSAALATLDHVSRGRAGWQVRVGGSATEARLFGRRAIPETDVTAIRAGLPAHLVALFDEAADVVEAVRRLWDSWEDDAEIRDVATRRFIDRDKVHRIGLETTTFSIRGPGITPRPPQGQPVIAVLAHQLHPFRLAARSADLVFLTPQDESHARQLLVEVDAQVSEVGRVGEPLRRYADLLVLLDTPSESGSSRLARLDAVDPVGPATTDAQVVVGSAAEIADRIEVLGGLGFDGIRLRPGVALDDLTEIVAALVPELVNRGLIAQQPSGGTLRARLGLPAALNRYASL